MLWGLSEIMFIKHLLMCSINSREQMADWRQLSLCFSNPISGGHCLGLSEGGMWCGVLELTCIVTLYFLSFLHHSGLVLVLPALISLPSHSHTVRISQHFLPPPGHVGICEGQSLSHALVSENCPWEGAQWFSEHPSYLLSLLLGQLISLFNTFLFLVFLSKTSFLDTLCN